MESGVIVLEYDPDWVKVFDTLRKFVLPVLRDIVVTIEHVGSTSVPGLAAKPIIDMDVVVRKEEDVWIAIRRLVTLGYVHQGDLGITGREAFISPPEMPRHHLYICSQDNAEYKRHVLFRDYLRQHLQDVNMYGDLKLRLAAQFRTDRAGYIAGKDHCINEILYRALKWQEGCQAVR